MLSQAFEFALCLIEIFSIYFFMSRLFPARFRLRILVWLAAFLNASLQYLIPDFGYLKVLFSVLTITALTFIVFRIRFLVASLFSLMSIYIYYIIDVITGNLLSVIISENIISIMYDNFIHRMIICLIVKLLDILALLFIYYMFRYLEFDLLERKSWILFNFVIFVFLAITAMFIIFYSSDSMDTHNEILYLILAIMFFIMSMIVIHFLTYILKSSKDRQKLLILDSNYEAIKENLELQEYSSERMSKIRHDMKNHLSLAHTLISQSDIEGADSVLLAALAQTDEIRLSLKGSSGNCIIDAIIASKAALCQNNNIHFEYYLDHLPEISMDTIDISSILSNILDNAIEAAVQTEKPEILIKIVMLGSNLNVFVKNSFNGNLETDGDNLRLFSTKKNNDSMQHGYGTKIIREIAAKYSGDYVWNVEGDFFYANAFLNVKNSK